MTDRKRTTAIQVRVTEQEKRKLERQARRCGLSLSGYLRRVGAGKPAAAFPSQWFHDIYRFSRNASGQGAVRKTGGNAAYHAYQSVKPGEVTPELCHWLGVELAKRMRGDKYATHFNTGTYHNHFVTNSVGLWDGRKFNCGKRAYYQFRQLSDDLCKEYQLSTIKNPNGKIPRSIYFAEKNGEPTRYNLMREALDAALKVSVDGNDLRKALREQGYELDANPTHKYATLRRIGSKKAVRLHRLGEGYDLPALRERIEENRQRRR